VRHLYIKKRTTSSVATGPGRGLVSWVKRGKAKVGSEEDQSKRGTAQVYLERGGGEGKGCKERKEEFGGKWKLMHARGGMEENKGRGGVWWSSVGRDDREATLMGVWVLRQRRDRGGGMGGVEGGRKCTGGGNYK